VQSEDATDGVQFSRLDEFRMRDGDCEQRTIELCFPEGEKVLQRREIWKQIVVPARRKFAATSDDPDGGKRFPLLSVRSLTPAS
jgi:hypothetical protein